MDDLRREMQAADDLRHEIQAAEREMQAELDEIYAAADKWRRTFNRTYVIVFLLNAIFAASVCAYFANQQRLGFATFWGALTTVYIVFACVAWRRAKR